MESITSISNRRNNTIDLTTSNNGSLFNYSDLSVGVVHYNMEAFGENKKKSSRMRRTCWTSLY